MNFFAEQYQNKDLDYFGMNKSRKKCILDLAGNISNKNILDVGCGLGLLGKDLRKNGNNVFGIDVSNVALEAAKKELDEVMMVDLENNNWPDDLLRQRFDLIIAAEIIEHLLYPEKLLEKLAKLLKVGGQLIITTPNFLVWSNRIKMLFGRFAYQDGGFWCRDHIHFFTLPELKKVLSSGGWEIVAANHLNHPKIPVWLNKLFPSLFAFQLILKVKKR